MNCLGEKQNSLVRVHGLRFGFCNAEHFVVESLPAAWHLPTQRNQATSSSDDTMTKPICLQAKNEATPASVPEVLRHEEHSIGQENTRSRCAGAPLKNAHSL